MKLTPRFLTTVTLLSLLFGGCGKQSPSQTQIAGGDKPSKPLTAPPEVTSESEEGYHDLVFFLQDHKKLADGSQTLRGAGTYKSRPVGFEISLSPTWKGSSLGKDIPFSVSSGKVTYRTVGAESDTFIQILDELYGTKLNPKAMRAEVTFTGLSLEGNPGDLSQGPVKIKTFYEAGGKDDYAEFFTNIELDKHRVEFREKDEEYRPGVLKALRAP